MKTRKSKTPVNTSVKTANKPLVNTRVFEIIRMVFITLISIFMIYPPFLRGLYFEENQLPAEIFVFVIFIGYSIFKLMRKDRRFLKTALDYAALALVVVYFISVAFYLIGIRVAAAPRLAVLEWLKYCMYFSVFFMITDLVTTLKSKIALLWVIIGTAVGLCIVGFDGAAGGNIINILNNIFKLFGSSVKIFDVFVSNRIYSTIQYPNAFASYLLAVVFLSLTLTAISSKIWVKAIGGACSSLFLISLIFTQSRGVLVIGLIPALIFILALAGNTRIKVISLGIAAAIPSILVTLKLYGYMMAPKGNESKIWLLLLLAMVLSSGLTLLFNYLYRRMEQVNWKVYIAALGVFIAVFLVVGVVALNSSTDLVLSHADNQPDGDITVLRSTVIKPGKDYKLVFDVDARIKGDKPNAYSIFVNYKREKDIVVNDRELGLTSYNGTATNGVETREVKFSLPADSKIVNLYFRNTYQGTQATIKNVKIVDAVSGKTVKSLILKYKFIPQSAINTFSNMFQSRSFIERVMFYKDGLKMLKDRPILGAGGGAWTNIYFYYQSFSYSSTQAHNYFIQIAIECGVVGILVFLFLILSIVSLFISEYRFKIQGDQGERMLQAAIFAALIGLLIHSFFDFDFSLSAVFLLFWQLLAIFNSRYRNNQVGEETEYTSAFVNKLLNVLSRFIKVKKLDVPAGVILVPLVIILFLPLFITGAKGYAREAIKLSSTDVYASLNNMKSAAQSDPFMAEYKIDSTRLILSKKEKTAQDIEEIKKLLKSAERLSWYDRVLIAKVGSQYISISEMDKGLSLFDRATELRPLWPIEWQQRVGAYYSVAQYYIQNGKKDNAVSYIDMLKNIESEAIKVNKKNLNPFIFDAITLEKLEKLRYAKEKIQSLGKDEMEKLLFNSFNGIDINSDKIPDQWTASDGINLGINNTNNTIFAENKAGVSGGYIQSRNLSLVEKKKYKIEVEFLNKPVDGVVPFVITGLSQQNESLKLTGNVYTGEFSTPEGFKASENALRIFVTGKYDIKNIKIIEV